MWPSAIGVIRSDRRLVTAALCACKTREGALCVWWRAEVERGAKEQGREVQGLRCEGCVCVGGKEGGGREEAREGLQ